MIFVEIYRAETKKSQDIVRSFCLLRDLSLNSLESQSNTEAAFLKGHLAILLGLLCDGAAPADIALLLANLPGQNDHDKIDAWVEAIRDFTALYANLAKGFAQAMRSFRLDDVENSQDDEVVDEDVATANRLSDLAVSSTFNNGDEKSSEKGVELANHVLHVLSDLSRSLPT